jgi:hypothetical protein
MQVRLALCSLFLAAAAVKSVSAQQVKPPTKAPTKATVPPPVPSPVKESPIPTPNHPEYTAVPNKLSQANVVRARTAYVNKLGFRHDPDGITWMGRDGWIPWDGVTTYNPCKLTKQQLFDSIFPPPSRVNSMRGIREVFYQVKPFANNSNPTVSEIENWNIEVIRHFRRLLGFNQTTHPVRNDKCTYLKAAWAEERARTNYWSAKYPGTPESDVGPCTIPYSRNAHCGASFLPNPADQAPYLSANMGPCSAVGGAEGVSNIKTDIPWAIFMGRIIGQFLASDGIGAHTGPFVGRELFGSAWYQDVGNPANTVARTKWSGNLAPTCP